MLYTFNFLECECSVFDSIPYISFYIDDYEYKLHKSNFIMRLPRTCKLDIVDNYFDNTTWELSVNFLKEYSLLFNYTDNSVTFYNVSNFNSNVYYSNPDYIKCSYEAVYYATPKCNKVQCKSVTP